MEQSEMRKILELVRNGELGLDEAMLRIREAPFTELGYAKIDNHRQIRQGFAEVIYGEGKSKDQICGIAQKMLENGVKTILVTRLSPEKAEYIGKGLGLSEKRPYYRYHEIPHLAIIGELPEPSGRGRIVVASGGTSDLYVSEEAALTAEALGNRVVRLTDVGVSGLHRLLSHMPTVR